MNLLDEKNTHVRVEMTPIMDVIFLLLVFFIYAFMTMSVQHGMNVDLPHAAGSTIPVETIQVVLSKDNEILLDGQTPLPFDAAVNAVVSRQKTLGMPVIIRADRQSHTGSALELLAALRAHGVKKVTYQVEKAR